MSEEKLAPDLLDLKLLPAWVKESPNDNLYADFTGEEGVEAGRRDRRGGGDRRERGPRPPRRPDSRQRERGPAMQRPTAGRQRPEMSAAPRPAVDMRFLPDPRALESVLAQIKAGHLAYSVFSLARMFLEKPERYDVGLKAKTASLFQLGEKGPVASDQGLLENAAFPNEKENFYRIEVTQAEPIKGNFTSVARCRLSGTLLGPTNHHAYQPQLRNLYEQRFSRRMSFPDYQRQIELVNDPAEVERWKEEARSVTTYTTLKEDPPLTFSSAADAERHFRQNYLASLLRSSAEVTLDGVVSRGLPDRALSRVIEEAWAQEVRSPSKMMQELIGAFRESGLHVFRHRKAMLFVSPVRGRPFSHESSSVSPSVVAILGALTDNPGINRKVLLEKLPQTETGDAASEVVEKKKLALAFDLRWLINEGHVIEFNDGSLDLVRAKAPKIPAKPVSEETPVPPALPNESRETAVAETAAPAVAEEKPDEQSEATAPLPVADERLATTD